MMTPDFFANQSDLDAALASAETAYDGSQESHIAINNARYAVMGPSNDFAKHATQALGGGWLVQATDVRRVTVWSPSGATCRYKVEATKTAVMAAVQELAKSYWSFPDRSTGSTGQSWWDENG